MATVTTALSSARLHGTARKTRRIPLDIWLALSVVVFFVAVSVQPGLFAPGDPLETRVGMSFQPPSLEHPFGTDQIGRDVYTRVIWGAQYSLSIGLAATSIALIFGAIIGLISGLAGGWFDQFLSRLFDVIGAFPEILLALFLISFTSPGTPSLIAALGIAGIPAYARLTRAGTLIAVESDFFEQSRTFGTPRVTRILRHVLPHAVAALPIFATIGLGTAVLSSAGLSFLGLGPQPPQPEWGAMLNEGRNYLQSAWWIAVFPGLFATLVVFSVTAIGRWWQRRAEGRK